MKVEFLYFEGCPNFKSALELLRQVLAEEGVDASVEQINVTSTEKAVKNKFLGSPSIRVNGLDIEKEARDSTDYGEECRIYLNDGALPGIPPKELIRDAVREAS